jgi:hypothetical protein
MNYLNQGPRAGRVPSIRPLTGKKSTVRVRGRPESTAAPPTHSAPNGSLIMTSVRDRARDQGLRDGGSVIGLPPPLKEKSPVPSPDRRGCHGPKVTRCRGNCTAACLGGGILMTKKRRRFPSGPPSAAVSQQHDMAGCSLRASAPRQALQNPRVRGPAEAEGLVQGERT